MDHESPHHELSPYREVSLEADPDAELARSVLEPHLAPGERVVWTGRPALGVRLSTKDIALVPFTLLWGGFAIVGETMAVHRHAPLLFCLWGLPFVVVGQFLIWGRFLVDSGRRARTFYGLTSSRALIATGGRTMSVRSVSLAAARDLTLTTARDGRGTIAFGPQSVSTSPWNSGSRLWLGRPAGAAFEHVAAVRDIYQRILALQAEARRSPS